MKYIKPTLENCEQEPIHIIGSIQSIGYVLVLTPQDLQIVQVSRNIEELLDCSPEEAIGGFLDDFFPFSFLNHFNQQINLNTERDRQSLTFEHNQQPYILEAHFSDGLLVMEVERDNAKERSSSYHQFSNLVDRFSAEISHVQTTSEACQRALEILRPMLGFDRMMAYRFDENEHGAVVAESKDQDLASYQGLKFPSTDIPKQARKLYLKNTLRGIYDVNDQSVPIYPIERETDGQPLDLSQSFLRSVSPIHVSYLKNMGVRASFSISLIVNGKLWGLILCHHTKEAVKLNIYQRRACSFIARLLSHKIEILEQQLPFDQYRQQLAGIRDLMTSFISEKDLHRSIKLNRERLLKIFGASDYVLKFNNRLSFSQNELDLDWLQSLLKIAPVKDQELYSTHKLADHLPQWKESEELPAGMLVLNLSREQGEVLIIFRDSQTKTVDWAGKPDFDKDKNKLLTPRNSFEKWSEVIKSESEPWCDYEIELAHSLRAGLIENTLLLQGRNEIQSQAPLNQRLQERMTELEKKNRELQEELKVYRLKEASLKMSEDIAQEKSRLGHSENIRKVN